MFYNITLFISLLLNISAEPQLEEILKKHYKSINIEELAKIKSMEMTGKVEYFMNEQSLDSKKPSLQGNFREYIQLPAQRYYESKFDNFKGSYRQAYNFGEKWTIDGGGLKTSTLNKEAWLKAELWFDIIPNLYNLEQRGFTPKYLGERKFDDQNYYCIKLTHKYGVHFYYLDVKSCLVKMILFKDKKLEEEHWRKIYFSNYKRLSDVLFAHTRYDQMYMGNGNTSTMQLKYKESKTNTSIDPSIFNIPKTP